MTSHPIRVGLILHSTRSDNLGVGALTVSEIEILRRIGRELSRPLKITIFDWKGDRRPCIEGDDIRIVETDRNFLVDPRGYLTAARRNDLIIDIGAGDSFADIYGTRRLRRMFLLKALTHVAGTPLVMAPQTIGPFTKTISRKLARVSLHRCAIVSTRDAMSTQAARELGVRDVIEASDVALRLPWDEPAERYEENRIQVGINVSGLLMGGGYTGRNEFGLKSEYPERIRDLISHFLNHEDGCDVHLVPHVLPDREGRTHREDDFAASRELTKEFPEVILPPRPATPSDAKTYIAGLDFFMGARMHACIAAFSSGVPVVPMAYSRKFEGLFGSLGYDRTVDCTTETREVILNKIIAAFEERDVLKAECAAALERGIAKLDLYRDALKDLMRQL